MFDMLPDWEVPKTPKGYEFVGIRVPQVGDYMVDYYGKPFLITKSKKEYFFENQAIFRKKVA